VPVGTGIFSSLYSQAYPRLFLLAIPFVFIVRVIVEALVKVVSGLLPLDEAYSPRSVALRQETLAVPALRGQRKETNTCNFVL
jgi:hypothetical protein